MAHVRESVLMGQFLNYVMLAVHVSFNCPLNLRKIAGTYYQADELATLILKNKEILETNGGGVTFSGGEPLMQHSFVLKVIERLEGLHSVIETSGYASPKIFKSVIDAVDYVIMDIKMIDSKLHTQYCGKDNNLILQNLEYLKQSGKPLRNKNSCYPWG